MNFTEAFKGYDVPDNIKKIATNICKRFVIRGICDPMYIANTMAHMSDIGDGSGTFTSDKLANTQKIAERLQGCYGCNIQKSEVPELKEILDTGEIDHNRAIDGLLSFIARAKAEKKTCDSWRIDYLDGCIAEAQQQLDELLVPIKE